MNSAALVLLPVYRITTEAAFIREIGRLSAGLWLNNIRNRLVVKVASVERCHSFRRRWKSIGFRWLYGTVDIATTS